MYRTLVVDDEPYIVDWIASLIETHMEPEIDVCRAYSSKEALSLLGRAKIDIIITDIRMPEISGIELAQKVNSNWPQCKVIFLTAYAEFDYACEAIRNNVVSYILKEEKDEYILSEVQRAVRLLDDELNNQRLLEEMQQGKELSLAARREILTRLLQGDWPDQAALLLQLSGKGVILTPDTPFLLLMGQIENLNDLPTISERINKMYSVGKIVEYYMSSQLISFPLENVNGQAVWLMVRKPSGFDKTAESCGVDAVVFAQGMLDSIQQSCMQTSGVRVSFVLHSEPVKAAQISSVYRSVGRLMDIMTTRDSGFIITDSRIQEMIEDTESSSILESEPTIDPKTGENLRGLLFSCRFEDYADELEKLCAELSRFQSWHSPSALELYYSAAAVLISYINQKRLATKIGFKIGLSSLFRPFETGSWAKAGNYLQKISSAVIELSRDDKGYYDNHTITVVRKFIDGHLAGDVSLIRLAEVTGYNASYLSRFYREKTGETLNEYIGNRKMELIRKLMADERLNINEISKKAGFESRTSFNRFIKNSTGLSPQKFRESIWHG